MVPAAIRRPKRRPSPYRRTGQQSLGRLYFTILSETMQSTGKDSEKILSLAAGFHTISS